MKSIMKIAVMIGIKPISILLLIISCLAVAAGMFLHVQTASVQQQEQLITLQEHAVTVISQNISSNIAALNKRMAAIAEMPQLAAALSQKNDKSIEAEQPSLSYLFPEATKVCLIASAVDDVDENACIPISFATLNSLRQAKKEGFAQLAVMQIGTANAHVLLAQRITNKSDQIVGVLVITLKPDFIAGLLNNIDSSLGYIEIEQGTKTAKMIAKHGDPQWKQGKPSLSKELANSHWRLSYWPTTEISVPVPLITILGLIIILSLLWMAREKWQQMLMKQDVATLRQQLADFSAGTLKLHYPMAERMLQKVVQTIHTKEQIPTETTPADPSKTENTTEQSAPTSVDTGRPVAEAAQVLEIDPSIFKAYDIRGIVGKTLSEDVVRLIGQAIGSEASEQGQEHLIVGRDGRLSSESLSNALIEGILASGCSVIDIDQVPTPLMYFACEHIGTHSGVMVTGSHNPADYNGLKVVVDGKHLAGEAISELYNRIEQGNFTIGQGTKNTADVVDDYIDRIVSDVHITRPIKVVIDCGNAVAGTVAPKLLQELGCDVIELYCDVDGTFPNHHPNPGQLENLQDLIAAVQQHEAELGIAFDGDGDRIAVVDVNGEVIWSDQLMVLFAQDVLSREPGAVVLYDVKSTSLLGEAISRAGGEAVMTPSGHSLIKNKMLETGAQLAGEMSGHIFFKERWYGFDDGLYAACRLLEFLTNDPLERTPTEVFAALPQRVNTPEILVDMNEGESKRFIQQLQAEASFSGAQLITIDGLRADYPNGWGLVRASNTLPGLTLRFEANTAEELEHIKQLFKQQMLQVKPTLTLLF